MARSRGGTDPVVATGGNGSRNGGVNGGTTASARLPGKRGVSTTASAEVTDERETQPLSALKLVPGVTEAGAGVVGTSAKRPPQRKLALATKDDTASDVVAGDELESAPVTPKPKPKPKRTPKPKPAVEHAAAAEPGAAEEPAPKPKPKRTPKPKVPQEAASASPVDTDGAEAAPQPKPKPKHAEAAVGIELRAGQ